MTDAQRIVELMAENRSLLDGSSNAARRIHDLEAEVARLREAAKGSAVIVNTAVQMRKAAEARAEELQRRVAELEEGPFAKLKTPWRPYGNAGAYSLFYSDINRAQALLSPQPQPTERMSG